MYNKMYFQKVSDLTNFQPKYLFYLVNKIPKWIFDANAPFSFSAPRKMKLFLLIISESIYLTKKVVKQKNEVIKNFTNKILYIFYLTSIF